MWTFYADLFQTFSSSYWVCVQLLKDWLLSLRCAWNLTSDKTKIKVDPLLRDLLRVLKDVLKILPDTFIRNECNIFWTFVTRECCNSNSKALFSFCGFGKIEVLDLIKSKSSDHEYSYLALCIMRWHKKESNVGKILLITFQYIQISLIMEMDMSVRKIDETRMSPSQTWKSIGAARWPGRRYWLRVSG